MFILIKAYVDKTAEASVELLRSDVPENKIN